MKIGIGTTTLLALCAVFAFGTQADAAKKKKETAAAAAVTPVLAAGCTKRISATCIIVKSGDVNYSVFLTAPVDHPVFPFVGSIPDKTNVNVYGVAGRLSPTCPAELKAVRVIGTWKANGKACTQ